MTVIFNVIEWSASVMYSIECPASSYYSFNELIYFIIVSAYQEGTHKRSLNPFSTSILLHFTHFIGLVFFINSHYVKVNLLNYWTPQVKICTLCLVD